MLLHSFILGGLSLLCSASPMADMALFEEIYEAPHGWKAAGSPAVNSRINFRIALNAADPSLLVKRLEEVSTPGSSKYGHHLSKRQLEEIVRPSSEGKAAVHQWLKRSGATNIKDNGEWVHFTASVEQANSMMNTKFLEYRHLSEGNAKSIRTTKVSLPRSVMKHVKMIHPTTRFTQITAMKSAISEISEITQMSEIFNTRIVELADAAPDPSCNSTITPTCLRELYNIKGVSITDPSKVGVLGVAGFLEQWARFNDLTKFTASQAPWAKNANFTWSSVNGGVLTQNSAKSASEANLDIQYTIALSHPTPNHYFSTAGKGELVPDLDQPTADANQNEPYLEFFQELAKNESLPHTISFSYGENEQSVPPTYRAAVCDLIGQLGTRGVSIIFASGDTGVGSACQTNDGKNTTRFLPTFPASCPWVTSIGGTVGVNPERAVGFSSGGFSDAWERPKYQEEQVSAYLKANGAKWAGKYNEKGRGFPDISAQGVNYVIYDAGRAKKISGTSASAPAVAGMIGLLNAKRLQSGQPALGFLNPWLYKSGAQMMNDITLGGSTGCTGRDQYSGLQTPYVAGASWKAVPGWDPVTGMGTPKFDKMLELLPAPAPGAGQSSPAAPKAPATPA